MPQANYQEPIEKEDLDLKNKFQPGTGQPLADSAENIAKERIPAQPESMKPEEAARKPVPEVPPAEKGPSVGKEAAKDEKAEQVSEKIETARKTIQAQRQAAAATNVQDDARAVAGITEYEKKVEKLVQIAFEKGPVHAIEVARHLDASDNYTLDELHDKMIEEDLRKQLIQKGLLKEL